jgi:glycosyltransferase involved in cell wall biosynthesis
MISVVMPAYNAVKYIRPAVDSILKQDIPVPDLVVVDDGSTDGTREVLQEYAHLNPTVRLIQTPHGGGSRALNTGIEAARHEWVAVMHADDIAAPQRLRRQLASAEQHPEVVVWGTHGYHINGEGRVLGACRYGPRSVAEFHAMWNAGADILVLHPTAMLRRDVVRRVGGYDPCFTNSEDFDLFMRMAHHGPVVTIPEPLLQYRIHANTNTMKRFFVQREMSRYVSARRQAELAGHTIGSLAEFREQRARSPLHLRARRLVADCSFYCYRKAAMLYGQGQYPRAVGYVAGAAVLNPKYVLAKVWLQLLSPSARRLLKDAERPA